MLPLPQNRLASRDNANRGLLYNKFVDKWPNRAPVGTFKGLEQGKQSWVDSFCGQADDCSAAAARVKSLAEALGGATCDYVTDGPLLTGMGLPHPVENGFLWHHTLGVPYLPGSSIKGMIRAWLRDWCQEDGDLEEEIDHLFGNKTGHADGPAAGAIIVFDALPTTSVNLYCETITPHTGDWRITKTPAKSPPADWVSPVPIPFLAIEPGAVFQFALAARDGAGNDDLENVFNYLEQALEWIGAGAKTAVGFGRFSNFGVKQAEEDQQQAEWLDNLKDGDEADYFGQHVRVRDVDRDAQKAGLINIDKNKSLGRKALDKLKPWKGGHS